MIELKDAKQHGSELIQANWSLHKMQFEMDDMINMDWKGKPSDPNLKFTTSPMPGTSIWVHCACLQRLTLSLRCLMTSTIAQRRTMQTVLRKYAGQSGTTAVESCRNQSIMSW